MFARFFKYTELRTKITSLFAFLMSTAYLFYIKAAINPLRTMVFFASMFIFDLTTTAINNYTDSKTNGQDIGYGRRVGLAIILAMLFISVCAGLYLYYLTDIVVLVVGVVCFTSGIFYTFGPLPISRQPLGEIFSGVFYGFMIPFLIFYINLPQGTILTYSISWKAIGASINLLPFAKLILLSFVPLCTTADIMLANNICDLDKDIRVNRFTLPYYLGEGKSVYLFALIYYGAFADILLMVFLRILPPLCLLVLVVFIPVQKNIIRFIRFHNKRKTFVAAIKNYIFIMGATTLTIFIGGLI